MKDYYVKTLLYAYPNIGRIIFRIDEIVKEKALNSKSNFTDCVEQCEKIVNLTVQKGILYEIKYYLELILSRLSKEEKGYIEFKFFKKKREEFNNLDLSSRNYFRKQQKLFNYVCNCFEWLNLSDEWFEKNAKKCLTLKNFCSRFC